MVLIRVRIHRKKIVDCGSINQEWNVGLQFYYILLNCRRKCKAVFLLHTSFHLCQNDYRKRNNAPNILVERHCIHSKWQEWFGIASKPAHVSRWQNAQMRWDYNSRENQRMCVRKLKQHCAFSFYWFRAINRATEKPKYKQVHVFNG